MTYSNCVVQFLYDWQTLAAGILALIAAGLALRPVYKQLGLMRAQNDAILREKVGEMIVQLDAHSAEPDQVLSDRMKEIHTGLYHFEFREKDYKFDEWCGERLNEIAMAEHELKRLFARSHEVEALEVKKVELLAALSALNGVLWDVHAPDYFDRDPEECSWTDEERKAAVARSIAARDEIQGFTDKLSTARGQLRQAFTEQRSSLLSRLRVIDDRLLA